MGKAVKKTSAVQSIQPEQIYKSSTEFRLVNNFERHFRTLIYDRKMNSNSSQFINGSDELPKEVKISLYLSDVEVAGSILFAAFFGSVGFVQNIVVILSIVLTDGFLEVPANIFVLSLACADFLVCGVSAPLLIYNCYHWIFTEFITVSKFIVVGTTGSIFLMTVNRFVSIVRPLKYAKIMTYQRSIAMAGGVWLVAAVIPILATIGLSYDIKSIVHITRYFLAFYIMSSAAMYVYMYILARKHREQVAKLKYAVSGQMQTISDEFRALRSLFLVAGSFVVCWLPMTIGFFFTDRNSNPETFHRTFSFTAPLVLVNAMVDPNIYYYRSKGFRFSLKMLARRFKAI